MTPCFEKAQASGVVVVGMNLGFLALVNAFAVYIIPESLPRKENAFEFDNLHKLDLGKDHHSL